MKRTARPHLSVATCSHAGLSGKKNEDRFAVASYRRSSGQPVLFAVISDGIGGHLAGDVAADLTVQYISQEVSSSSGEDPLNTMEMAIHSASQAIASRSASKAEQSGMGATCACAWIEGDRLYIASVGDSRIYLVRDNHIRRLTVDHTWVQEALEKGLITQEQAHNHPNVHVLRRHLGSVELPEVDLRLRLEPDEADTAARDNQGLPLQAGDILLLCSDGLSGVVEFATLRSTLQDYRDLDDLHAQFLRLCNLSSCRAAGAVSDLAPITQTRDIRIEIRTDDEVRAMRNVQRGCRRIYDRANAQNHIGMGLGHIMRQLAEHRHGQLTPVGKLEQSSPAASASPGGGGGSSRMIRAAASTAEMVPWLMKFVGRFTSAGAAATVAGTLAAGSGRSSSSV